MIRILTDSTADFTHEQLSEYRLRCVPLTVNFGQNSFLEGVDLTTEEFYEKLQTDKNLPTTSQPSPDLFLQEFEDAKAAGEDVVTVVISGQLSGTLQSAKLAAELSGWEDHIYIVDSLSVTLGEQLLVRRALALRESGYTAAEIAQRLEEEKSDIRLYAVVDTLTYLQKGGRLPKAAAIAGTLMGIKPVIAIEDGKVKVAGKARGLAGAYVHIFKLIAEQDGGLDILRPFILGYTGSASTIRPFEKYIQDTMHLPVSLISPIGAVIGTHAGPGACGIAYFAAKKDLNES